MATSTKKSAKKPIGNSPGVLVLQWLTYAFWGWTVLALTWLTAIGVSFFINREDHSSYSGDVLPYALAAVIVLFIISAVVDALYSRSEPMRKQGAAMVIMIIHAVIFALCGIGALITAVFAVINIMLGTNWEGNEGALTVLTTGAIIAVVYGATLLRTLRPVRLKRAGLFYAAFMALVTVSVTALAIAGPALYARETKDDRLIERGLPEISTSIRNHAAKSDALPATLASIREEMSSDAKQLVDRQLVEYTPGKKIDVPDPKDGVQPLIYPAPGQDAFEYRLCVTYKGSTTSGAYDLPYTKGRDTEPNTYSHAAGRVCYDLVTEYVY